MISAPRNDAAPAFLSKLLELLVWCLPALLLGGWLRWELLRGWQGALYFGPDSGSYLEAVFRFHAGHGFEVSGKRPCLYPALVWLASFGPISPAFSVALVQQFAGWLSIAGLGALIRAVIPTWRWWIIPATALYAVHPELLYWSHVLIADSLFTSLTVLIALVAVRYWRTPDWRVLVAAAALIFLAMALRPVGRALWLSFIPLALLVPGTPWRLRFAHATGLAILYFPASAATRVNQGEDLLFASTLPLMRLDTPLHAKLKAELRPQVEKARADLWQYVTVGQREFWGEIIDDDPVNPDAFLQTLRADKKRYRKVRSELSREALRHAPLAYAEMLVMKIYSVFAINDAHERFSPERWAGAGQKFLTNTFRKIDPGFPAFLLRDSAIHDPETLRTALAATLTETTSQSRALRTLHLAEEAATPFQLAGKTPDRWWWIVLCGLGVFVFPWTKNGHRILPVLILAAGYLGMTYLVGRAVGRYRLPVEFAGYVAACAGLATFPALWQRRARR